MANKQIVDAILVFKFRLHFHWDFYDDLMRIRFRLLIIYSTLENISIILKHGTN